MQVVLLGLPGAGKGTQAKVLSERLGLLHISTGDMFREAVATETELGMRAQEYMSRGELVPDDVTISMLLERVSQPDAVEGIMLDGFPRTIPQAEALDRALHGRGSPIDTVLYIQVPESELMTRLTGRWTCPRCGAIYHVQANPPSQPGVCDEEQESLTQRADDQPDTVQARLETNRQWTEELAAYYERVGLLHCIDGTGDPEGITVLLLSALDSVLAAG